MYTTCLSCNAHLGTNTVLPSFPVGRRLAFDGERGRLWVVCTQCGRWNLTALEERWEAIEDCEREFRGTRLRVSTDNIGLAQLRTGLELIRVGRALRPEIAAWRYGRHLRRVPGHARHLIQRAGNRLARALPGVRIPYDAATWLRIHGRSRRVLDVVAGPGGESGIIRYAHLETAELIRPDLQEPWQLLVRHDTGTTLLSGHAGIRAAGKLLAALNGSAASAQQVQDAIAKLEDAGNPDGYFARVAALALRTSWGRFPDAPRNLPVAPTGSSDTERLALYLTNRSFWARGGTGSEPRTLLPLLPLVDRLALEMAANEDLERRAMQGELAELEAAWREAEEIAAIADGLLSSESRPHLFPGLSGWLTGTPLPSPHG